MVKHDGPACRACGTPILSKDEIESGICDTCYEWNVEAVDAVRAIDFAERERQRAEQDRWKQRRKAP